MIHYNLTAEEMLLAKMIFIAKDYNRELFVTYQEQVNHSDLKILLQNLQDKKIIIKNQDNNDTKVNIDNIEFNKNFLKGYLKYSYDLGMELLENYPSKMYINGQYVSLKNVGKYYDYDRFCYEYGKAISFNINKHNEIIKILKTIKEQDLDYIHYGICDFVASRKWNDLKEELENHTNYYGDVVYE